MNELDFLNNNETIILNDKQKKECATNELYNFLDQELSKNYYSWLSLQNNKQAIIYNLIKKYNITNESDIIYIKNKFDSFHRKLKKANEYQKKQVFYTAKYITDIIIYSVVFGFIILILTV